MEKSLFLERAAHATGKLIFLRERDIPGRFRRLPAERL